MPGVPAPQRENLVEKMNATTATLARGKTPPAHVGMFQLLNGMFVAGAISCLAQLGIPDLVEHGPKSAAELATAVASSSADFGPCSTRSGIPSCARHEIAPATNMPFNN